MDVPHIEDVAGEIVQLRRRAADLERQLMGLRERLALFSNPVALRREKELSEQLDTVNARIVEREALLFRVRGITG